MALDALELGYTPAPVIMAAFDLETTVVSTRTYRHHRPQNKKSCWFFDPRLEIHSLSKRALRVV
ncbi:hypothetical protein V6Z92_002006 [Aspergillus fumigatus]